MRRPSRIPLFLVTIAAAVVAACGGTVTQPTASTSTSAPIGTGGSTLAICHTSAIGAFARTIIPTSSLAAHLAHGDALPGHFVPGNFASRFDSNCAVTAVQTVTIAFSSFTSNGAAVTALEEQGFHLSATEAPWEQMATYGAPAPALIFKRPASTVDAAGTIELHANGELFAFDAVDFYSSVTPIPYTITGRLRAAEAFVMSATVPNTFGRFARVSNTNTPRMIDSLVIRLVNPATACCPNPVGLDNLTLKR